MSESTSPKDIPAQVNKRIVRNPYAQKKAPRAISNKPLHSFARLEPHSLKNAAAPIDSSLKDENEGALPTSAPRLPWKHLPSQQVSFGSAEVLTVSELREHAQLYIDKDVRVAGLWKIKHFQEDGTISLVIRDPLGRRLGQPVVKTASTCTPQVAKKQFKTPAASLKKTKLMTRRTPAFSLSHKKRKPALATDDSLVQELLSEPSIWAVLSPEDSISDQCAVGDLIMIIGQVQAAEGAIAQKLRQKQGTAFHLKVRIAKNVNGANMRLHWEALQLRRQYLRQRKTDNHSGCGPSPA